MMRILLDEGMPARAALKLRDLGFDTVDARELGLAGARDEAILAAALTKDRICVTLDHDFHSILAETQAAAPSVILVRLHRQDTSK